MTSLQMMSLKLHAHCNYDTTTRLFPKHRAFYTKSKFKNGQKSICAFEKHADDVTSVCPILPQISEVVRK